MALLRTMAVPTARSLPSLVLHLDVNKTLLFVDPAGGLSLQEVLHSIIADNAWGVCTPSAGSSGSPPAPAGDAASAGAGVAASPAAPPALDWRLSTAELSQDPPTSDIEVPDGGKLVTYTTYVKKLLYPYKVASTSFTKAQRDALQAHNRAQKEKQKKLCNRFVEPSQPGHVFASVFKQLEEALTIPEALRSAAATASHLFRGGARVLCPAYFYTVQHLAASGREFALVFRTFGTDLPDVVEEHNMFCAGRHPLYPDARFDGSGTTLDLRVHTPHATGAFLRHGHDSNEFVLATTTATGLVDLVTGFDNVRKVIHSKISSGHRALAFRDCYQWWSANGEVCHAAKPLLLAADDASVHEVFFDDNIEDTRSKIVDVRDVASGTPLDFHDVNNVHIVRVDSVGVLLDEAYFVKRLAETEAAKTAKAQ